MIHKPIVIKNFSLSLAHKTCFEDFNFQIHYGNRIAIIGRNASGKTTLLNLLRGSFSADVCCGHVPQTIEEFADCSGGQRFHAALTQTLSLDPNVLLLDEPTNHLDRQNRQRLMRMLRHFPATLIVATHDTEFLRNCVDTLWHIDNGKIYTFTGNYDDYIHERRIQYATLEQELSRLHHQKKEQHQALMKEQGRAKKSNLRGEKSIQERKWPTIVSQEKARRAIETSGKKKKALRQQKENLLQQLSGSRLPKRIVPKFNLGSEPFHHGTLVSIRNASVGYTHTNSILKNIYLSINAGNSIAIAGNNGSGKTTLIKAILNDPVVKKSGEWDAPKWQDIGYLDQHYATLHPEKTVFASVAEAAPSWSDIEVRNHLNDFLFYKNEIVYALTSQLSGGEKARLCLAQIAAKTPKLLILDEITNNLDLETKEHVIHVLKAYPGTMIVISHDEDFLKSIGIVSFYQIFEDVILLQKVME